MVVGFFFFQAEDGIRDLVRSRGLGDVYKRQALYGLSRFSRPVPCVRALVDAAIANSTGVHSTGPVSYTHLTLPTSDLV